MIDYMEKIANLIHDMNRVNVEFLSLIKIFLVKEEIYDISPTQAIIIYNEYKSKFRRSNGVGDFFTKYLGENVSYNLQKLIENENVIQKKDPKDRRKSCVSFCEKSVDLCEKLDIIFTHFPKQNFEGRIKDIEDSKVCIKNIGTSIIKLQTILRDLLEE